jgi:PAS domain S-box-containing protein
MNLNANEGLVDSRYEAQMDRIQLLETILENSAESIYAKDRVGRYIYVNRAFEVEMKLARERALGRTDFELLPPEHAEKYRSSDLIAMQTRKMEEHETWWNDKIYLTRKKPLISSSGEVVGVCGNTINVTSRRRTELALQDALMSLERERDNKLLNLDVITASIAHEIKQPLAAISANLSAAHKSR